ncbi:MAG: haloacid dehalogenase-like hydrolase [Kiritimatiellae bacterium]|nr:haloacid dehalogenase-like hydrolase [Kiritimatiellia bacterium]
MNAPFRPRAFRHHLFDVDSTLLDTRGAGRAAFAGIYRALTGIDDDLRDIPFAGNSDAAVSALLCARLAAAGHPVPPLRETISRDLGPLLEKRLAEKPPVRVPGALAYVEGLAAHGAFPGLITGNTRKSAFAKVAAAGFAGTLFSFGGYGDFHEVRRDIVFSALASARAAHPDGPPPSRETAVVYGDTEKDVAAAREAGLRCVGIAAGRTSREDLLAAGADWAFDDFRPLAELLATE